MLTVSPVDMKAESLGNQVVLGESFEAHVSHCAQYPSLEALKRQAWDRFNKTPMPVRTDEAWRFSRIQDLNLEEYHLSHAGSEWEQFDSIRQSKIVAEYAGRMVFEDNYMLSHDFISDELAEQGVIWEPLLEAFEKHPELVERYLGKTSTELGSQKFHDLNLAYAHSGAFLYVPDNVKIKDPLMVYHWAHVDGSAIFPHTIVVAGANAQVNLVEVYGSMTDDASALSVSCAEIFAGPNAHVVREVVQEFNHEVMAFELDTAVAQVDSTVTTVAVNLGSKRARFENQARIEGAHADVKLFSLTMGDGEQEFDQRTHQVHVAGHARSNLLYKNALLDDAKSIFSGLIKVAEGAQKTDAYQTNRNLLLSPTAEADSLPGLEILANDVKCSHGATTGQVDEREIFYLMSRGLPRELAQELLIFGFFEEVIAVVGNEALIENIREVIREKFNKRKIR